MMFTEKFTGVTVFILAYKETTLLQQTVSGVLSNVSLEDLEKIVVVLKTDDCPSFFEMQKNIEVFKHPKIEKYIQKGSTFELCIAELPPLVNSSHFIIMMGDMEMDPSSISDLVAEAKKAPDKIICGSKWMKGSVVEGYNFFHKIGSKTLNLLVGMLLNSRMKDLITLFQIYPIEVYRKMNFKSDEDFFYEYTFKPLRFGVGYKEIPTVYKKRPEGSSNFTVIRRAKGAVKFITTAAKIRFMRTDKNL